MDDEDDAEGREPAPVVGVRESVPLARLERALGHLGSELHAPVGWEDHVLVAVCPRRRSRTACSLVAVVLAAGALCAAWLLTSSGRLRRSDERLTLSVDMVEGAVRMRCPCALRAIARGGGRRRALRIYREQQIFASCPGHAACRESGDQWSIVLNLPPVGNYQVVALGSAWELPGSVGSLDRDLAALVDAGASWTCRDWEVR